MAHEIYKIYLAERSDGQRYVGCTKNTPGHRIGENYHPMRSGWKGPGTSWPIDDISTEVLFYTTDIVEAAKRETQLIAELNTMTPHGKNFQRHSGYCGSRVAREAREAA